jgi:diguanylate cyclase (GGDEF)-like protein
MPATKSLAIWSTRSRGSRLLARVRPSRPRPLSSGEAAVWALDAALIGAGMALFFLAARSAQPIVPSMRLPLWALLLGFAAAERFVVHVHFRRSAHSLSLGELPLVFGLIFASGQDLVLAGALGTLAVLILHRRLPAVRLGFNLGQFWLGNCVAVLVFHATAGSSAAVGPSVWAPAALATAASSVMTSLLIGAAVSLSEGGVGTRRLAAMVLTDLGVAVANTSIALVAATLVFLDWRAAILMALPVAAMFAAYRAYLTERQRHERLEFLYEAARTLSRSPEIGLALEGLLTKALEAFRADVAEILLFSSEGHDALRTTVRADGPTEALVGVDPVVADELRSLIEREGAKACSSELPSGRLADYLESRGLTGGMLAVLRGEGSCTGAVLIGKPAGVVQSFAPDDLKLFEALANNTSVALQYDHLGQAVWRMKELQEKLQHQASHDPLTDLANRSLFTQRLAEALADGLARMSVIFIDIDDFKTVNDSLGHAAGDDLLIAVARRLEQCIRPTDTVARLGGDEFAILLRCLSAPAEALEVADRVMCRLAEPFAIGREAVSVRASAGIAISGLLRKGADELIRDADVAMYRAKQRGKHRYELFEPGMETAVLKRHGLKQRLREATRNDSFVVHYQPIAALDTGDVVAAEALVRWLDGSRGLVSPQAFIPLAEETGLIVPIGRTVLERACYEAQSWERRFKNGRAPAVHVNISPLEIQDPGFVPGVAAALACSGLNPGRLVLEITESLLLQDPRHGIAALEELRGMGIQLALDDFGTGYASLSHLRSLPLDALKIAKPFVEGVDAGDGDRSFVRMIVQLADSLGVDVVAEGIESRGQLTSLRELGCGFGQGFYIARPRASEERLGREPLLSTGVERARRLAVAS